MLTTIGRLYSGLLGACVALAGALVLVGIGLVVVDVTIRASGLRPPGFTVAFVEYILLYFTLLAAPWLVRQKGHVLTDIVILRLPRPLRWAVAKTIYALCIVIALVFAWMGGVLFEEGIRFGYMDERSVDIPYWALYVLYPLSFSMIAIEFARYLLGVDDLYVRDQQLDSM